jgi:DNA-directed RNA polymerase subunit RPC12/RpoP
MDDFRCPNCGRANLAYPKVLQRDAPVTCANCGAFVLTYSELKRRSESALASKSLQAPLSGC